MFRRHYSVTYNNQQLYVFPTHNIRQYVKSDPGENPTNIKSIKYVYKIVILYQVQKVTLS